MIKLGLKEAVVGLTIALMPEAAEAKKPHFSKQEIADICAAAKENLFNAILWGLEFETNSMRKGASRAANAEEIACRQRFERENKKPQDPHRTHTRGRGMEIEL